MSQDNTSPRDGSPHDQGKEGSSPTPETPPPASGEQPHSAPLTTPSGLQPDPAPELDPDFVPNPSEQPDPALPPESGEATAAADGDAPDPAHSDAHSDVSAAAEAPTGTDPHYPWQQPYPPQQPTAGQPYQTQPYPGHEPGMGQEWQPEQHGDPIKRQRLVIGGIVLGVLVLIGVVIWVLLNLLGTRPEASVASPSATSTPGPLPRDTNAKDFQVGDCFASFDPKATEARAVECGTEHSAQLGAVFSYGADESFPGATALRDKGREVCKTVKLNKAAANYILLQQNVYPSSTSWDRGDRRVDCFIVVDSGNTIKENLLDK
jgi:hypothetical protein